MQDALPLGKLPAALLGRFLGALPADPALIVGPGVGEDAAVLRIGEAPLLVAAADPITFPTPRPGWYAVHVNANDVATRGAEPRWFLATVLLPPGCPPERAEAVLADVAAGCAEVGAVLAGGHTEVTASVRVPVVAGCMLGVLAAERPLSTAGARPGDRLLLSGRVGAEGASILAAEAAAALRAAGVSDDARLDAATLVERHGISVLPAARHAAPVAHALHDLTEGGLATGVQELADASGLGVTVSAERVVIPPETAAVCRALRLDPLGLLSSGCLLIAVPPEHAAPLLALLTAAAIPAADIGELHDDRGLWLERGGTRVPLPSFARDELARWLDEHGTR